MSSQQTELNFSIGDILIVAADPCSNRHRGNENSVAAHSRVLGTKSDVYKRIMNYVRARGTDGATSKEIAAALGRQLNTISGRFAEMKQMGWLKESGEKRNGAAVLILV